MLGTTVPQVVGSLNAIILQRVKYGENSPHIFNLIFDPTGLESHVSESQFCSKGRELNIAPPAQVVQLAPPSELTSSVIIAISLLF